MSKFKTHQGVVIDNLRDYVRKWLTNKNNIQIWVGCDSQVQGSDIAYAVTVCLYEEGKGAHVITKKTTLKNKVITKGKNVLHDGSNNRRLWDEVEYSIEAADELKDLGVDISIHVDYNSKPEEVSNQLYDSGIGYAMSKGYAAVGKPFAVASTYAADREVR
jgi:predicted RNase H-related nuclease YkuK (DUF458 family)